VNDHHLNWLKAIRTRQQPITNAEIAYRSCSACLLQFYNVLNILCDISPQQILAVWAYLEGKKRQIGLRIDSSRISGITEILIATGNTPFSATHPI